MSYVDRFADVNGANYFTPQCQMDAIIRHCAEGTSVAGKSDLHAVQHLERISKGMKSYLDGNVPGSEIGEDTLLRQMVIVELASIKTVIDTPCPIGQTKALRDIIEHGSLSSARMKETKAQYIAPQKIPEAAPAME